LHDHVLEQVLGERLGTFDCVCHFIKFKCFYYNFL
jgi:hypothetical protein